MSELKCCPFCGCEAEIKLEYKPYPVIWCRCSKCFAKTNGYCPSEEKPSVESFEECKEKAIKAWNTRKPMEKIKEQIEVRKMISSEKNECDVELDGYVSEAYDKTIEIVEKGGME